MNLQSCLLLVFGIKVVGTLNCLEVDVNQRVLFVGGSVAEGGKSKHPILCALTFDSDLKLIDLQKITDDPRMIAITTLKRHPNTDILFAGTFDGILIVQWIQSRFYYINLITTNSPTPVIDICFHRGKLYAVSEFKTALLVAFGDDLSNKPVVRLTQSSHSVTIQSQGRNSQTSQFTAQQGITYHPDRNSENSKELLGRDGSAQYPSFSLSPIERQGKETLQPNFGSTGSNKFKNSISSMQNPFPPDHNSTQYTKVTIDPSERRFSQSSQKAPSEKLKIDIIDPSPQVPPEFKAPPPEKPVAHPVQPPIPVLPTPPSDASDPKSAKISTSKLPIPIKDQSRGNLKFTSGAGQSVCIYEQLHDLRGPPRIIITSHRGRVPGARVHGLRGPRREPYFTRGGAHRRSDRGRRQGPQHRAAGQGPRAVQE